MLSLTDLKLGDRVKGPSGAIYTVVNKRSGAVKMKTAYAHGFRMIGETNWFDATAITMFKRADDETDQETEVQA